MGFSYRKSFKAGPFRVTASKSGISYSAGVPGARITKKANGKVQTTLSAPGTGLRYTATSGTKKPSTPARRAATSQQPSTPHTPSWALDAQREHELTNEATHRLRLGAPVRHVNKWLKDSIGLGYTARRRILNAARTAQWQQP